VQRLVEVLCDKEINVSRKLWSFSLLRHEQLRESALMEAGDAEMIIISVHANTELPPHVAAQVFFCKIVECQTEGWVLDSMLR
jgi:hypothetical protein